MPARRILDNEEQLAVIETVRDAVTSRLAPQVAEIEEAGAFPWDAFRTLGEIGVLGMAYPEEYGGLGLDMRSYVCVMEEIAKKSIQRKTGARGLRAIMENVMMDYMYHVPSDKSIHQVVVTKQMVDDNLLLEEKKPAETLALEQKNNLTA